MNNDFFTSNTKPEFVKMDVETLAHMYIESSDDYTKNCILCAIFIHYTPKRLKTESIYKQLNLDYDEVDSVYFGIMAECLRTYNPEKNTKFSTFLNTAWNNKVKNMKRPEDYTLIKTQDSLNRPVDNGDGETTEMGFLIENKNAEDTKKLSLDELYSIFDGEELVVVKTIIEMIDEHRYAKSIDNLIKRFTGFSKDKIAQLKSAIASRLIAEGVYC